MSRFTTRTAAAVYMAIAAGSCISATANATDIGERLAIHGYGHSSYFYSEGEDSFDDALVSVLFIASVSPKSKVWVQLHNTAELSHLDWAFVDYHVDSQLTLRAGQIKLPIGVYNEIIDSRFLHQSTLPPLLYQEGAGFTAENFRGAAGTYTFAAGAGRVALTGYAGEVVRSDETPETTAFDRLFGAHVAYTTPIDGLRLIYSGYRNKLEDLDTNAAVFGAGTQTGNMLSLDYVAGDWDVKSEYGRIEFLEQRASTAYAQFGRTLAQRWTPFVRYDYIDFELGGSSDQTRQRTYSLGLNARLNDNMSLRAEAHHNRGFAVPYSEWLRGSPGEPLDPAQAPQDASWNSFGLSISFIF